MVQQVNEERSDRDKRVHEAGASLRLRPADIRSIEYAASGLDPEHMELCRFAWIALFAEPRKDEPMRLMRLARSMGVTPTEVKKLGAEWALWSGYRIPGADSDGPYQLRPVARHPVNDLNLDGAAHQERGDARDGRDVVVGGERPLLGDGVADVNAGVA